MQIFEPKTIFHFFRTLSKMSNVIASLSVFIVVVVFFLASLADVGAAENVTDNSDRRGKGNIRMMSDLEQLLEQFTTCICNFKERNISTLSRAYQSNNCCTLKHTDPVVVNFIIFLVLGSNLAPVLILNRQNTW